MDKFKILEGLPVHVSEDVNLLLANGWALNGPMFTRVVDNQTIVGQCLTHFTATGGNFIVTCMLNTTRRFDPHGILNCVYSGKQTVGAAGTFNYLMKIRTTSCEAAEEDIMSELRIQILDGDYNATITMIDMVEHRN